MLTPGAFFWGVGLSLNSIFSCLRSFGGEEVNYIRLRQPTNRAVGKQVILLLIGGDKSTQDKDIEKAKKIWDNYRINKNESK